MIFNTLITICDVDYDIIITNVLNLSNKNLTKIPKEIKYLINLTDLNFSNNQISEIENLETLTNLRYLNLDNNQINKIKNLKTLTKLKHLSLNNNQISKIKNLEMLTKLALLFLNNNQITKIENITNLMYLDLSNNYIDKIQTDNFNNSVKLIVSAYNQKYYKWRNIKSAK